MSDKEFRSEIVNIVQSIQDDDDEDELSRLADSLHYFKARYPDFSKRFENEISKVEDHKTWSGFLREINFWNTLGIPQMYRRTMLLSMRFTNDSDEFFRIDSDIGSYTLPTKLDKFLKMALVAEEFVYEIFPKIENNINFKSESIIESSETIRGTINWNKTILNSLKRGEPHPRQFTCIINQNDFETPENVLAIMCLLKIQTDLEALIVKTSDMDYTKKELRLIFELKTRIDFLVSHSHMRFLISKFEKYRYLDLNNKIVNSYELQTKNRIQKGIIKQKSYSDLLEWMKRYKGYNMEDINQKYSDFPIKHKRSLDTMYELWIFFEMLNYFREQKNVKVLSPLKNSENRFRGFELEIENKRVKLNFQYSKIGWAKILSTPDMTFEIDGQVPIIMDPKNYRKDQGTAINKMLAYLLNLGNFGARVGILFFPYGIGRNNVDGEYKPIVETTDTVFGKTMTLSTVVLNPTKPAEVKNNMSTVFDHVYETVLGKIR